jgi:hypothetical protein
MKTFALIAITLALASPIAAARAKEDVCAQYERQKQALAQCLKKYTDGRGCEELSDLDWSEEELAACKRAERVNEDRIRKIRILEKHGGCPIEECPPTLTPGGRAFAVAAKRQFGRGVAKKVGLFDESQSWTDCFSHPGKCVGRGCSGNWGPPKEQKDECDPRINPGRDAVAVLTITDARYLGVDKDYANGSYLLCNYRIKPVLEFFKCTPWEGE